MMTPKHVSILVALIAHPLTPLSARAQDDQPSKQEEPSSETLSTEEDRWAAEKEPSQLEPPEKQTSEPTKFPADVILGLRSGYGFSGGRLAEDGSALSDALAGQVPIQLDLGALLENGLYFGAYGQYGFGVLGSAIADACNEAQNAYPNAEISCSAFDVRVGLAFEYHHGAGKKRKPFDPWLGIGSGIEFVSWKVAAQDADSAATLTQSAEGFEYISGHLGVDYALADWFAVGPYFSITVGSYGSADQSCEGDCEGVATTSGDIANTSLHTWAFIGLHALFQLGSPPVETATENR